MNLLKTLENFIFKIRHIHIENQIIEIKLDFNLEVFTLPILGIMIGIGIALLLVESIYK